MLCIYRNMLSDCSGNLVSLCLHVKFGFLCRFSFIYSSIAEKSVKILSIFWVAIMETTQDWIVHNFTNSVCSKLKLCLLLKCSRLNMCQNLLYSNYAEIFMTQNVLKCSNQGSKQIQDSRTTPILFGRFPKKGTF